MTAEREARLGAVPLGDGSCAFRVWAPDAREVAVRLHRPEERRVPLGARDGGYHEGVIDGVPAGARYRFELDGTQVHADPASRFQPEGVHGPSAVTDPSFDWSDEDWRGLPLESYVLYEIHVGTFSEEGTFAGAVAHVDDLVELGVTAIELMPVAQFPGARNWGYDGAFPFAAQDTYGGPDGLRTFVDECHRRGLAVVLDVVYNHVGPEGSPLAKFGPYFTDAYRTPWGAAINFDGAQSDDVRRFFIQSALYWVEDVHIDALRLDAIHAILDRSPRPFLAELAEAVHARALDLNRRIHLIAEDDRNDPRIVRPEAVGGFGLDAQWNDDFHHALHAYLTKERTGYYADFGAFGQIKKAIETGYVYTGQHSAYRKRRHGSPCGDLPLWKFVVFAQNHDQVGNRALGDRLARILPFEALKLVAAWVLLSPSLPLLFMGEEWGETTPFQYFVSHSDPDVIAAVRKGRRGEFRSFEWPAEPPDPQDPSTFLQCKVKRGLRKDPVHAALRAFYREAIALRRTHAALRTLSRDGMEVEAIDDAVLRVRRRAGAAEAIVLANFADAGRRPRVRMPPGAWRLRLDSAEERWGGPGSSLPRQLDSDGDREIPLRGFESIVFDRREAS